MAVSSSAEVSEARFEKVMAAPQTLLTEKKPVERQLVQTYPETSHDLGLHQGPTRCGMFRSVLPATARQERLSHHHRGQRCRFRRLSDGARTESPSDGHPPVVSRAARVQALDCPAEFISVKKVTAVHVALASPYRRCETSPSLEVLETASSPVQKS